MSPFSANITDNRDSVYSRIRYPPRMLVELSSDVAAEELMVYSVGATPSGGQTRSGVTEVMSVPPVDYRISGTYLAYFTQSSQNSSASGVVQYLDVLGRVISEQTVTKTETQYQLPTGVYRIAIKVTASTPSGWGAGTSVVYFKSTAIRVGYDEYT